MLFMLGIFLILTGIVAAWLEKSKYAAFPGICSFNLALDELSNQENFIKQKAAFVRKTRNG